MTGITRILGEGLRGEGGVSAAGTGEESEMIILNLQCLLCALEMYHSAASLYETPVC